MASIQYDEDFLVDCDGSIKSLTPIRVPAETKVILFSRYVLNFYVGIVQ